MEGSRLLRDPPRLHIPIGHRSPQLLRQSSAQPARKPPKYHAIQVAGSRGAVPATFRGVKPATPERLLKDVGRRVAELRVARAWTQEQLAERLDVGTRYVQAVESGRQNITLKSLALFAGKLRVPAAGSPRRRWPVRGLPGRAGIAERAGGSPVALEPADRS